MNVIWLSLKEGLEARGYWDQRLLEELFEGQNHIETNMVPNIEDPIIVIPGAYQGEYIDEINTQIQRLQSCTVIITSDEENNFPIDELSHENMRVFANYYNPKYTSEIHWLPIGPANVFPIAFPAKTYDFVFEGQVTHPARENYIRQLRDRPGGSIIETQGFAQGDIPEDYYKFLASSKTAPSPAGNISPDAFRTWEAICAGAVPIPTNSEWHHKVFGEVPFPIVDKYQDVNGYIDDALKQYPVLNNDVQVWWLQYKRNLKQLLIPSNSEGITIFIPVSPIKSHPDPSILYETIRAARVHLPDAEIIVMMDGVRAEQEDRREDYERFKRVFLWDCLNNPEFKNILPLNFKEHSHQVKMAREAIKWTKTDLILYCEQDTPLTPDVPIDWEKCEAFIRSGDANMIRFHFEAFIPEPHKYMMLGEPENGFQRTAQWSQRPNLISKAYLQRVLTDNFSSDAVCFIEDKMHGVVYEDYKNYHTLGWLQHRVWIYHPEGNIKRSYHTDGRAGGQKWDDTQIW